MRNSWMPEVFNDFFDTDFMPRTNATAPAINVKETEHEYTVELAAPEMKKEHYLRREFSYSKYEQTLILPDDVDKEKIAANVADGVLSVSLPKVETKEDKVTRQIEVK